jgi:hypothetical protein
VALSEKPSDEVVVTLRSSAATKVEGTPGVLRFRPGDFDVAQTVALVGKPDRDAVNEMAQVVVESEGLESVIVSVSVIECPTLAAQDFWLMFNPNVTAGRRDLHIAGASGTMVTIAGGLPMEIPASGLLTFDTGMSRVPTASMVETGKAIQISASAPVQVFANNFGPFTVDAFTAVPVQLLGTDYRAIGSVPFSQPQISVYATEDNTAVTIAATPPVSITLNRGQSYLRVGASGVATGDITGIQVTSDKPVAVNTGDACVATGTGACDHTEEMLFPVSSWANDFYIPALPQPQEFRIVAATAGTAVTVDGVEVATLAAGEFYASVAAGKHVQTSQPAEAFIIAIGDATADASFILMPGTQNGVDSTTFSAFAEDNINTLVISMPTAATASLRLDGALTTATWTPYVGGAYSYAQIGVTAGVHKLSADEAFIPVIWGEKPSESYGYVAGYGYPKARCQLP